MARKPARSPENRGLPVSKTPLHYLRVERDTVARARELAGILGLTQRDALGGLVMLWDNGLAWTPPDRAPDGVVRGPNALRRVASAFGWGGPPRELCDALSELGWGEYLPDGYRLKGVAERYAEAWQKATGLSLARAESGRLGGLAKAAKARAEASKTTANGWQSPGNGCLDRDGDRETTSTPPARDQVEKTEEAPPPPQNPVPTAVASATPEAPEAWDNTGKGSKGPAAPVRSSPPASLRVVPLPLPANGLSEREAFIARLANQRQEAGLLPEPPHRYGPELDEMRRAYGDEATLRFHGHYLETAAVVHGGEVKPLAKCQPPWPWDAFKRNPDKYAQGPLVAEPRRNPKRGGMRHAALEAIEYAPEGLLPNEF